MDVQAEEARQKYGTAESDDGEYVRLIRHTIPHFIPLQKLVSENLRAGGRTEVHEHGGLHLLNALRHREGLVSFLSRLHAYLQAYVARREQAIALRMLPLPSRSSALEAYSDDGFGRLSVTWDIPDVTPKHILRYEEEMGIDRSYIDEDPTMQTRLKGRRYMLSQRRERHEQDLSGVKIVKAVQIVVHVRDQLEDHIGPISQLQQSTSTSEGLACINGTVKVEVMRHLDAHLKTGKSKKKRKSTNNGEDDDQLKLEYTRRIDLERHFADPDVSIDRAVRHAIEVVWREEVKAASDFEHDFLEFRGVPIEQRKELRQRKASTRLSILSGSEMDEI